MNSRFSSSRIEHGGPFSDPGRWLRAFAGLITGTARPRKIRRARRVRWIEGATPDSEEAAAIREALTAHGCNTYEAVTRRAAELLFRRDFAAGGWFAGIGLVLPSYLSLVRQTLERVSWPARIHRGRGHPWS
jgi:hypothetical protein